MIFPVVKKLLVASQAGLDVTQHWWIIEDVWTRRVLSSAHTFPFRQDNLFVYIQLTGGRGSFRLGVAIDRLEYVTTGGFLSHHVGIRFLKPTVDFPMDGNPLDIYETAIPLQRVPFRKEAEYRIRIVAQTGSGYVDLPGEMADIGMLEPSWRR